MILRLAATVAALALSVGTSFGADITVGFVTSEDGDIARLIVVRGQQQKK